MITELLNFKNMCGSKLNNYRHTVPIILDMLVEFLELF